MTPVGAAALRLVTPSATRPEIGAPASRRVDVLPPGERERRAPRADRRSGHRRKANLGSPYGSERRSGVDDRQGDRRGGAPRSAGIGLARDYFAQHEAPVATAGSRVQSHLLVRFRD